MRSDKELEKVGRELADQIDNIFSGWVGEVEERLKDFSKEELKRLIELGTDPCDVLSWSELIKTNLLQ